MAVSQRESRVQINEDDWTLTTAQTLFLMQNHNAIETAFAEDNLDFLREFGHSAAFLELFGEMPFDEAYDRYETMLEAGDAT